MTNSIFRFHDTTFSIEVRSRRAFPKNLLMFLSKISSSQIICRKYTTKVTKMITSDDFLVLWATTSAMASRAVEQHRPFL